MVLIHPQGISETETSTIPIPGRESGSSQVRVEESKPPAFEPSPRTDSNGGESATSITRPADDQGTFRGAHPFRDACHFHPIYDANKHDPFVCDAPSLHVEPTEIPGPAQGTTGPPSLQSDPSGGLQLPGIATNPQFISKNSDGPGTEFSIPGTSGEVGDGRPYDSAVYARVMHPRSDLDSRSVADSICRVVDVRQLADKQIQPLEPHTDTQMDEIPSSKVTTKHDAQREQHVVRVVTDPMFAQGK